MEEVFPIIPQGEGASIPERSTSWVPRVPVHPLLLTSSTVEVSYSPMWLSLLAPGSWGLCSILAPEVPRMSDELPEGFSTDFIN